MRSGRPWDAQRIPQGSPRSGQRRAERVSFAVHLLARGAEIADLGKRLRVVRVHVGENRCFRLIEAFLLDRVHRRAFRERKRRENKPPMPLHGRRIIQTSGYQTSGMKA